MQHSGVTPMYLEPSYDEALAYSMYVASLLLGKPVVVCDVYVEPRLPERSGVLELLTAVENPACREEVERFLLELSRSMPLLQAAEIAAENLQRGFIRVQRDLVETENLRWRLQRMLEQAMSRGPKAFATLLYTVARANGADIEYLADALRRKLPLAEVAARALYPRYRRLLEEMENLLRGAGVQDRIEKKPGRLVDYVYSILTDLGYLSEIAYTMPQLLKRIQRTRA